MTTREPLDEDRLIELFAEIETPSGVDAWRDRAGVTAGADTGADTGTDADEPAGKVVTPLPERWLRPPRPRRRATAAMAAAVAMVVGLGGVLVVGRMLSDPPPAEPDMVIDGPDVTATPTSPTVLAPTSPPSQQSTRPSGGGTVVQGPDGEAVDEGDGDAPPAGQPVWDRMVGYPSADNTGLPPGTTLTEHQGDLIINTPGAVVTDLRVHGVVWVNAPDVTLRRVQVIGVGGTNAVEQNGERLRIQDSELSTPMGSAVAAGADGLVMIRNKIEVSADDIAAGLPSNTHLIENYVTGAGFQMGGGTSDVRLERNTFDLILMQDYGAPLTDVTLRGNSLRQVQAPTESASTGIRVIDNEFHGDAPCIGWRADGPDWVWSGNTHRDTGEPVSP